MTIGKFHSYRDFGLIPTSKPVIVPPSPKLEYIEIPGRQGELDITESLAGEVIYEMRTGSFDFIVSGKETWQEVYGRLLRNIHGKRNSIILDTEKDYVYQGRVWVSEYQSDKNHDRIHLEYKLDPYKYSTLDTKGSGEIGNKHIGVVITGTQRVTLPYDSDMTIVPEFHNKTTSTVTLHVNGKKFSLPKGVSRFPEIRGRKDLVLTFTGSSTIEISYRRGWL